MIDRRARNERRTGRGDGAMTRAEDVPPGSLGSRHHWAIPRRERDRRLGVIACLICLLAVAGLFWVLALPTGSSGSSIATTSGGARWEIRFVTREVAVRQTVEVPVMVVATATQSPLDVTQTALAVSYERTAAITTLTPPTTRTPTPTRTPTSAPTSHFNPQGISGEDETR